MDGALLQVKSGHMGMAACCAFYLIWWAIFFWPKAKGLEAAGIMRPLGAASLVCAIGFGFWGALRIAGGAQTLAPSAVLPAILSGTILYMVLLLITWRLIGRTPTTELALFCAWSALELFCAVGLAEAGLTVSAIVLGVCALGGLIASLACYLCYYELAPLASFACGCIPLALIGLISLGIALSL